MEALKKKGNSIKKIITLLWFVFCALSFLFTFKNNVSAEILTYKYTFDIGKGKCYDVGTKDIDSIKMVYTVEEDTSKDIEDASRYKIIQKELTGYVKDLKSNSNVKFEGTSKVNLINDSDKTIYNFLSYGAYASSKDWSPEGRKLMKAILFAITEDGNQITVEENGWKNYVAFDKESKGNTLTRDDDFKNYIWLYDRDQIDRDFYTYFNNVIYDNAKYTAYSPKYAESSMRINVNGMDVPLTSFFNQDVNVLRIINKSIQRGNDVGKYLSKIKVDAAKEIHTQDNYEWWLSDYDLKDNSVIVNVGPRKPTTVFRFKYNFNNDIRQTSQIGKLVYSSNIKNDYTFYYNDIDKKITENIAVYPEVLSSGLSSIDDKFVKDEKGNYSFNGTRMFTAHQGRSAAGTGDDYIYVVVYDKERIVVDKKVEKEFGGDYCLSISMKDLKKEAEKLGATFGNNISSIKKNNGYVFELDKLNGYISFYKENDSLYVGMNMCIDKLYSLFLDVDNKQYGLAIQADPTSKDGTAWKTVGIDIDEKSQYRLPALMNIIEVKNENGEDFSFEWSRDERESAMYFNGAHNSNADIILRIYDLTGEEAARRGVGEGEKIRGKKITTIAEVSITDWLKELYPLKWEDGVQAGKRADEKGTLTGDIRSNEEMQEELVDFFNVVGKYLKPLVMFLIFVALVLAAVSAIMDSNDAKRRVLLAQRMKNIVIGCIAFSAVFLIITIATHYFNEATALVTAGSNIDYEYNLETVYQADENWFINIIDEIINAVARAIKWIVNFLASRMLLLDERELNLSDAIFGVEKAGGITLFPFTEREWVIYMSGYRLLSTLAIALIAISLLKTVIVLIVNAGNSEKVSGVKQDFLRTLIAILAMVLAPYGIRLLLTLVNSLVKLVPISESKFNLTFDNYGFVGSIANLVYVITELKIYAAFVVRKIMIIFLLISTPFVFGAWTISTKIRSFSLWIGELLTNIFMQLAYSFVFFFLVIVLSTEQNPFAILLLLTMMIKLADFVKDSLQGLYNQWGGINETQVAEQGINKVVDIGKTMKKSVTTPANLAGRGLIRASNYFDPKAMTRGGKAAYNWGQILSGHPFSVRTKKDMYRNILNKYIDDRNKASHDAQSAFATLRGKLEQGNDKTLQENFNSYMKGELTQDKINEMRKNPSSNNRYLLDYIDKREDEIKKSEYVKNMRNTIDNTKGIVSSLQDYASNKTINDFINEKDKNGISNVMKRSEESLSQKIKEYDELSQKLDLNNCKNDEERNEKVTNYNQNKEKIIELMNEIINDTYDMSELAINLKIKPSINISVLQMNMSRELVSKYDSYDMSRVRKIDKTQANMKKVKEIKAMMDNNIDPDHPYMNMQGLTSIQTREREKELGLFDDEVSKKDTTKNESIKKEPLKINTPKKDK